MPHLKSDVSWGHDDPFRDGCRDPFSLRSESFSYLISEVAGGHIWGDERGRPGQVERHWLPPRRSLPALLNSRIFTYATDFNFTYGSVSIFDSL